MTYTIKEAIEVLEKDSLIYNDVAWQIVKQAALAQNEIEAQTKIIDGREYVLLG